MYEMTTKDIITIPSTCTVKYVHTAHSTYIHTYNMYVMTTKDIITIPSTCTVN